MHWCYIRFFFYSEMMRAVRNRQIEKNTKTRCTLLGGMEECFSKDISGICITGLCCCFKT